MFVGVWVGRLGRRYGTLNGMGILLKNGISINKWCLGLWGWVLWGCGFKLKNERRKVIQVWSKTDGRIDTQICWNSFKNNPNAERIETKKMGVIERSVGFKALKWSQTDLHGPTRNGKDTKREAKGSKMKPKGINSSPKGNQKNRKNENQKRSVQRPFQSERGQRTFFFFAKMSAQSSLFGNPENRKWHQNHPMEARSTPGPSKNGPRERFWKNMKNNESSIGNWKVFYTKKLLKV